MSEHDHIDEFNLRMREILDGGQEEVPAGLWESISSGLDRAERRKKVFMWFRYSGIAAAAAAAVALGFVFNREADVDIVPAEEQMIAVVEIPEEANTTEIAEPAKTFVEHNVSAPLTAMTKAETVEEVEVTEEKSEEIINDGNAEAKDYTANAIADSFLWEEEDERPEKRRIRTSLVISGIAGTNNPQNKSGLKPLRSPGVLSTPQKTTIEQIGTEITYGIPVSVGAGIKINFNKKWALGVGINYTLLTSNFNGKYTKVENGIASVPLSEQVKNTQHYIGIPINAYYNIISRDFINFYAYAGGAVEKCIENKYRIQTTPSITHKEPVKGVQLSADAGIGVEFLLGKHVGIYLDPSLRYYFKGKQPKSIRTAQPLMLGFEAGVRFNL